MDLDDDLRNGTLPLGRSVKLGGSRERLPRFRIRAYSAPIRLVAGWTGSLFEAGLEWHSKPLLEIKIPVDIVLVR